MALNERTILEGLLDVRYVLLVPTNSCRCRDLRGREMLHAAMCGGIRSVSQSSPTGRCHPLAQLYWFLNNPISFLFSASFLFTAPTSSLSFPAPRLDHGTQTVFCNRGKAKSGGRPSHLFRSTATFPLSFDLYLLPFAWPWAVSEEVGRRRRYG